MKNVKREWAGGGSEFAAAVFALANALVDGSDRIIGTPGLAIGTVSKKEVKVVNAIGLVVAGGFETKASAEVGFTATTHDITNSAAKIQEAQYLLSIAAGGTVTITKGTTANENESDIPAIPAAEVPLGVVLVQVAAGATPFDATTDDLDAAHLTVTYSDYHEVNLPGTVSAALEKLLLV
jgi:hypothetical protein